MTRACHKDTKTQSSTKAMGGLLRVASRLGGLVARGLISENPDSMLNESL